MEQKVPAHSLAVEWEGEGSRRWEQSDRGAEDTRQGEEDTACPLGRSGREEAVRPVGRGLGVLLGAVKVLQFCPIIR